MKIVQEVKEAMEAVENGTLQGYQEVLNRQELIHEKTAKLYKDIQELEDLFTSQVAGVRDSLSTVASNERLYRDIMHMTELSENLSVNDELELFRLLKVAVKVRRLGKDYLSAMQLPATQLEGLFTGVSGKALKLDINLMGVMDINRKTDKLLSGVRHTLTGSLGKKAKLVFPKENRTYMLRGKDNSDQYRLVTTYMDTRSVKDKKFKSFKRKEDLGKEQDNG